MRLAFCVDGGERLAGVVLREEEGGAVVGEVSGDADPDRVAAQVTRILSLDVDARPWAELGERDEVLGRLQAAHDGLRPVLFHSPYEAACWAVLALRRNRRQAMGIRERIGSELGGVLTLAGEERAAWPGPEALLAGLEPGPGVDEERVRRLRGMAEATLDGTLDPARLRALGPDEAYQQVVALRGLGPFYAQLVTVRAVGFTDVLPEEPRARAAAAQAYGLPETPEGDAWRELAERWRPWRTWAVVLLRVGAG